MDIKAFIIYWGRLKVLTAILFLIAIVCYLIWYFSDEMRKVKKQNEEIIKLLKELK